LHGRKRRTIKRSSSEDILTFNAGLMKEPAPLRAQVIVYELLHLKVPNHGMVFKALECLFGGSHGQDLDARFPRLQRPLGTYEPGDPILTIVVTV
jgi:predicted metal-dependent hydrolase